MQALAAAHGVLLHASLAERLRVHTGGLPGAGLRLVEELPRSTWASFDPELPAPSDVAAEVVARLRSLSAAAVALVEAVCVLGDDTSLAAAASLAGLDAPLAALDDAVAAGLLR